MNKILLSLIILTKISFAADAIFDEKEFAKNQLQFGFSSDDTAQFLSKAHYNQKVIDAISKPWEAKPWYQYYPIFLNKKRLKSGIEFWSSYAKEIDKAALVYNVEPEIIVAIIGIETSYGHYFGEYLVLDSLYTLGFFYPERADFFRTQLSKLQILEESEKLDLDKLKGSYAGAMGYGQFIPSSYIDFAVDFNNDGKRDLFNPIDAIGSVANYFHKHGWQKGSDVALRLDFKGIEQKIELIDKKPLHLTVAEILESNFVLHTAKNIDLKQSAALIELEQENNNEYWLGLNNFYVITQYNKSPLYAMAVYQFSQKLKKGYYEKNKKN